MKKYSLHKVNALPPNPEPDSIYFVKDGEKFKQVLIDSEGNVVEQAGSQEDTVTPPPGGEVLWFENYAAIEATPGEVNTFYVDNSDGQIYIWTEADGYMPEGEKVRVRPDWVEQDPNHPAYIFNKPIDEGQIPFITRWNVAAGETIVLPVGATGVNQIRVDWGDGVINNQHSHAYETAGVKTIGITGRLEDFRFNNTNVSRTKITGVTQWGDIAWVNINFYGCTNLVSLPTGLSPDFRRVTDLNQFLRRTGLSNLPSNLFVLASNVSLLTNSFRDMPNLTSIDNGLLANLKDLISVYAFLQDTPIQVVPEDLFRYNINLRNFSNAFRNAGMLEIPRRLFWYTENAETFEQCFYGADITSIPYDLFKYVEDPLSFADCFRNTALNNEVPELWLMFPNADGSRCFTLTTGIDNYAEIPESWGGPVGVPMPPQKPVDKRDYWNTATDQPQWLINGVWKSVSGSTGAGADVRLSNLAADLSTAEKTSIKTKLGVAEGGGTSETAASIKTKYESNSNTNAFTDALQTKLNGIATGANNYTHPSSHPASIIGSGTLDIARIPTGTTGTTVALGNHTHSYNDLTNKPTIPAAITNLNQIPTRSYNVLQDLPNLPTTLNITASQEVTLGGSHRGTVFTVGPIADVAFILSNTIADPFSIEIVTDNAVSRYITLSPGTGVTIKSKDNMFRVKNDFGRVHIVKKTGLMEFIVTGDLI